MNFSPKCISKDRKRITPKTICAARIQRRAFRHCGSTICIKKRVNGMTIKQSIARVKWSNVDRSTLDHFTLAIDCFIVIPFTLFLMQIVDPQWRKALRWILAAQIVFGVMRFLSLLIHFGEKFMGLANNVFVIAVCALLAIYYIAVRRTKSPSREITVVFAGLAIF